MDDIALTLASLVAAWKIVLYWRAERERREASKALDGSVYCLDDDPPTPWLK